jgi:hypothetical protein
MPISSSNGAAITNSAVDLLIAWSPLPHVDGNPGFRRKRIAGREMGVDLPRKSGSNFTGGSRLENMLSRSPFFIGQVLKLDEEFVAFPDIL